MGPRPIGPSSFHWPSSPYFQAHYRPIQLFEGPSKALGLAQQACCPAAFPPGPCLVCRGASLHGFLVMQADAQTQQAPCLLRPCMNRPSPAPTPSFFFTPCVRSGDQHENCFPMHSAGSIYTTAQQAPPMHATLLTPRNLRMQCQKIDTLEPKQHRWKCKRPRSFSVSVKATESIGRKKRSTSRKCWFF